ncbi:site-specific integrase [Diaphorobacter sp. HDW4A]|uniref:tyrosine-type recombinase/integrase n=1 Tax=Diaphorobacter sp. HDW4A TaxID=2714924 RepID=UPI00140C1AB5|nr:phage integrase SAM-like domain-containing protein [Diaphorobacter sp. HDW4A]QIL78559.1 site-specific integrase [Diaphorobacter sp. HDW4A]
MSKKPTIGDFAHLLSDEVTPEKYEIDLSRGILKADDPDDHRQMMEALQMMQKVQQASAPATVPQVPQDDPTALKLGELLEKFFLLRKQLTQATAIAYRNCITELAKFLKNPPITRITPSDITRYQEFLAEKGNSVRTIDNKISIVRALYNFAKKQGYTRQENPAENRALLTKKQRLKGGYAIFEKEEIELFFKSEFFKEQKNKDKDYTNSVILGLFTGCRIGEITNLKKDQFKISPNGVNYITIRDSKTLAGIREVPIHPLVFNRIKDFLDSKTDKVFKYVEKEGKGTGNAVGKKFARNVKGSGITRKKLVFHSLRKFVNNELLKDKVSLEHRCQLIGHELDNVNVAIYTETLTVDELAETVFPTFEKIYNLVKISLYKTEF